MLYSPARSIFRKLTIFGKFTILLLCAPAVANAQPDTSGAWAKVEQMPFFSGCEHLRTSDPAKRRCSDKALAEFITSKLVYPDSAAKRHIEGMVVVSFMVDETGNAGDAKVLRDIGGGCGQAAKNVVAAMPAWEPAVHKGRNVPVRLNLPVHFSFRRHHSDEAQQFSVHWGKLHGDAISKSDLAQNLDEKILVRDAYGQLAVIRDVEFLFEKGKKSTSAKVEGDVLDKKMRKIAEQAAPGGTFTIAVGIQHGDDILSVLRTFEIK